MRTRFARLARVGTSFAILWMMSTPLAARAQPVPPVAPPPPQPAAPPGQPAAPPAAAPAAPAAPPAAAPPGPAEAPPAAVAPPAAAPQPASPPPAAAPPVFLAAPPPAVAAEDVAVDGHPLAGFRDDLFYLRDPNDNFRLYVEGRAQVDIYTYMGSGVSDTVLHPTLVLRRIRPELTGEILKRWYFWIAGDWGITAFDNPRGANETSAAAPGQDPDSSTARYAPAQTPGIRAAPADVFIGARVHPVFNFQIGQFDAPFSLENRTSDKYLQFMERSLAVRDLGVPTNKEMGIMVWGETPGKEIYYSVGGFSGDGQNRLNVDNRFDAIARAFSHPLHHAGPPILKDAQIGASFRYGVRQQSFVDYDYPAMTTQGGFAFWSPIYKGKDGFTHVIPSGGQLGAGGELRVPISDFDLTGEFVYVHNDTREAIEGFQATNTERLGALAGYSYYVQLGWWPIGNRDINGIPGYELPSHIDFAKPVKMPKRALQLLAKWEQLHVTYDSASRGGSPDPSSIDGAIKVNVIELGANYWATKFVRVTANYLYNMFPGSAPRESQTSDQRAIAPGQTLDKGVNDDARQNAHGLHELLFRVAVAL